MIFMLALLVLHSIVELPWYSMVWYRSLFTPSLGANVLIVVEVL